MSLGSLLQGTGGRSPGMGTGSRCGTCCPLGPSSILRCPGSSVWSCYPSPRPMRGGDPWPVPGGDAGPSTPAAPPELQEKTLVLVKPDAVQRRLVGNVIQRFERRGFKLVAMKLLQVPNPAELPPVPSGAPAPRAPRPAQGGARRRVSARGAGRVSPPSPPAAVRRTRLSWTSTTSSCGRSPSTPRSSPT